jgi:hypothetical protein
MAGFDDNLVREYFEMHGFFVRQSRKPTSSSRRQRAEENDGLYVINPQVSATAELPFQLFSSDLLGLRSAHLAIKAWHGPKALTPSMIKKGDFLEFIRKEAVETAREVFAETKAIEGIACAKILILPGIPSQEAPRMESIQLLRAHGVDHVLTFRTILENLIQAAEANPGPAPSDTLQLLRLLRIYDMVKSGQMELFGNPPSAK